MNLITPSSNTTMSLNISDDNIDSFIEKLVVIASIMDAIKNQNLKQTDKDYVVSFAGNYPFPDCVFQYEECEDGGYFNGGSLITQIVRTDKETIFYLSKVMTNKILKNKNATFHEIMKSHFEEIKTHFTE